LGGRSGAAAIAYSLAWYGLYQSIDKATMVSGPPLSDVEEGCIQPSDPSIQVCSSTQFGCNSNNSPSSWTQAPIYTDALTGVRSWTGDSSVYDRGTCVTGYPLGSSPTANAAWKAMSIVDGTIGTFIYKNTNITSWLCANVNSPDGLDDGVMNNSSPQAQLFFQNFTGLTQISGLTINAVTNCDGDEGAATTIAIPPSNYVDSHHVRMNGLTAVEWDMTTDPANSCFARHTGN